MPLKCSNDHRLLSNAACAIKVEILTFLAVRVMHVELKVCLAPGWHHTNTVHSTWKHFFISRLPVQRLFKQQPLMGQHQSSKGQVVHWCVWRRQKHGV